MFYRVEHVTRFHYSSPVYSNRNTVRMTPRGQKGQDWGVTTEPFAPSSSYQDAFGNAVTLFHLAGQHENFKITATGVVQHVLPYGEAHEEYRQESWLVDFCKVSYECSRAGTVADIIEAIRRRMVYTKGTTDVSTKSSEVLTHGFGVCQDFAHAALAALRQAGYAARYVGGYSFGEGATHAWIEVFEADGQWHIYDPTNEGTEVDKLIAVAVGRDYRDTSPVLGSYLGAAASAMTTFVSMSENG